ncbi:uncharacterized protein LOC132612227 [Lycium barbarum]|uniref:uncharacterized protein LOC132612227 n=1 Tax=Lycium barbarum TaxID=112863 RepID=UPI00293F0E0C|nr:uncharacterized protein LOC132612227 [Lycium barbarum]
MDDPLSTNTQAEALAILQAMKYLEATQRDKILIETDSLLLRNIVEKVWEVPWQIVTIVKEIWRIMKGKIVVVSHIFREGNKLEDHLANVALDEGEILANNFKELDIQGRRLLNEDKLKEPYSRLHF